MKRFIIIFLGITIATICFGQQYPFPMNETGYSYPYGTMATEANNEKIQKMFTSWDSTMYLESTDYQYGRIRFDDARYTVSEGIGYGMLIYVFMSNETNKFCQSKFDKLYSYYKKWSDGNGLMNWKIEGFDKVNSYNAATDADLDVALALCLAAKQWGYSSNFAYAEEAEIILNNIYKKEVGIHTVNGKDLKVFNPGDSWNSTANSCYFTIASVGIFKETQEYFDFATKNDWETVYNDCHTFLENSQRNGLWPNWSNWDGTPADRGSYDKTSMEFGWDACRTPWRVAWDYLWFGSESSKNMLQNTFEMMETKNILENTAKAGAYKNLTGETYEDLVYAGNGGSAAFSGSFACALATDPTKQIYLDIYHKDLLELIEDPYYSPTLQIIYLIITSGNAANFFALEGCAPQKVVNPIVSDIFTDGKSITLTATKTLIENNDFSGFTLFLNGEEQTEAFTSMSVEGATISLTLNNLTIEPTTNVVLSYNGTIEGEKGGILAPITKYPVANQVYVSGGSTMLADCESGNGTLLGGNWYSYSDGSEQSYAIEPGGANETNAAIKFTYNGVKSYVGVGFNILGGENPLDCSGSTGISFYHKGDACILEAKSITKKNANYSYQTHDIEAHENWTLITLDWEDIASDFVTSGYVTEVTGLQWKEITGSGEFWLDEITLIGREIKPADTDKAELEMALIKANLLLAKATTDKYKQESIDELQQALEKVSVIYMDPKVDRETITEAYTEFATAIEMFQASAFGDKYSLEKAIISALTTMNSATIGTKKGEYTQESKDVLELAIAEAQNKYETDKLTITEISEAITTLNAAVKKFTRSKIKTAIQDNTIYTQIYPNPCVNHLNITANEKISLIHLYNTTSVSSTFIINQNEAQIDVTQLPRGLYFIQVKFFDGNQKTEILLLQ